MHFRVFCAKGVSAVRSASLNSSLSLYSTVWSACFLKSFAGEWLIFFIDGYDFLEKIILNTLL